MVSAINPVAQAGFSSAASYDKHRPSYPEDAVQQLLENVQLAGQKGAKVLDLAAGTGKFTELLAARPENYEIIAVEPHAAMRAELERKQLPRVTSLDGTGTKIPLDDHSVDAIIIAQAFHWFANKDALAELHRVIKPAGVLGMIWNADSFNSPKYWELETKYEAILRDVMYKYDDGNARFRHEEWKQVFDEQDKTTPFTIQAADPKFSLPLGENTVNFSKWLKMEAIWDRFCTHSSIAMLNDEELEHARVSVFDALNSSDAETNASGEVLLHGRTYFVWTSSIPDESLKSFG